MLLTLFKCLSFAVALPCLELHTLKSVVKKDRAKVNAFIVAFTQICLIEIKISNMFRFNLTCYLTSNCTGQLLIAIFTLKMHAGRMQY